LPELPEARRARFVSEYGITEQDAHVLTITPAAVPTSSKKRQARQEPPSASSNLVQGELMAV